VRGDYELQVAIYDALRNDGTLTALLDSGANGIYDTIPDGVPYPYVAIGDNTLAIGDNKTNYDSDGIIEIRSWTRDTSRKTLKQIMARISDLLTNNISVPGFNVVYFKPILSTTIPEVDNKTLQGLIRFETYIIEG
jgi:hypothetical protein